MNKLSFRFLIFALLCSLAAISRTASAQLSYNSQEDIYFQTFDALPASGTTFTWSDNITVPGWYAGSSATSFNNTLGISTGSTTSGNIYSFGLSNATDRALGSIASGSTNWYYGLQAVNNTGTTITGFTISYTGEQWRNSAAAAQSLSFQYSIGATTLKNGTYVSVPAIGFNSPITGGTAGLLNGNLTANRTVIGPVTVNNINWLPGTSLWLRFTDTDDTGFDHGLAIDNFSFAASGTAPAYDPPSGYYDPANGLSKDALAMALHSIISNNTVLPFTSSSATDTRSALKYLFEDPSDSTKVRLTYTGASVLKTSTSWDREHLWPASRGIASSSNSYSDLFNLRPSYTALSSARGNKVYDNSSLSDSNYTAPAATLAASDTSADTDSWQPPADERGDIARALFYMDIRYNGGDGNISDLALDNVITGNSGMAVLSTLVQWSHADPVSDEERKRNASIYSLYQHNRNPFVDHPEYVDSIFGALVTEADDLDMDGIPNNWETTNQFDAQDASDANADSDSDGFTNYEEYWMGSDPRSSTSPARFTVDTTYTGSVQDGSSSHPFKTIQAAVNAVNANELRAIVVRPGTYNERPLISGKNNTHIFSEAGAVATIIDGQQTDSSVVRLYGFQKTSFIGFTVRNAATSFYGGGLRIDASAGTALIANNIFTANSSTNTSSGGGGLYLKTADGSRVINNFITNNTALRGGGVLFAGGDTQFWFNTVVGNTATGGNGGGLSALQGVHPDVRDNIIWANIGSSAQQIHQITTSYARNNILQGAEPNTGNIDLNPLFVGSGDYHITPSSPAKDAAIALPVVFDFDGDARIGSQGLRDIGADELTSAVPASVFIINPTDGSTIYSGVTTNVSVQATLPNESISKVEVYDGSIKIGQASTAPYSVAWTGAARGTHSLTAKATNSAGQSILSSPIGVYVIGLPPVAPTIPGGNSAPNTPTPSTPGVLPPTGGTPNPGGAGNGPIIDQDPDYVYAPGISVSPRWDTATLKYDRTDSEIHVTGSTGTTSCIIERKDSTGPWHQIDVVNGAIGTYTDRSLLANLHYQYRAYAFIGNRKSEASSSCSYYVPFLKSFSQEVVTKTSGKGGFRQFVTTPGQDVIAHYLSKSTNIGSMYHTSATGSGKTVTNDSNDKGSRDETYNPSEHSYNYISQYDRTTAGTTNSSSEQGQSSSTFTDTFHKYKQERTKKSTTSIETSDMSVKTTEDGTSTTQNPYDIPGLEHQPPVTTTISTEGTTVASSVDKLYFIPSGTAKWNGYDYDLHGSFLHEGAAKNKYDYSTTEKGNPHPKRFDYWEAVESSDGRWLGTHTTDTGYNVVINGPPWRYDSSDLYIWSPRPSTGTITETSFSHKEGTSSWYDETLLDLYSTGQFIKDSLAELAEYPEFFQENTIGWEGGWNFRDSTDKGYTIATLTLSKDEQAFGFTKAKYKFKGNQSADYSMTWYEVFVPEPHNGNATSNKPPIKRMWDANAHTESPVFEVDPSVSSGGDSGSISSDYGTYYLVPAAGLVASDYNNGGQLDDAEKAQGGVIIQGSGYSQSGFFVDQSRVLGAEYTLTWEGEGFHVFRSDTGEEVFSGYSLSPYGSGDFYVTTDSGIEAGAFLSIHLSSTYRGASIGSDDYTVEYRLGNVAEHDYTIPLDDASGARYRKVALNGRPLSDEKPQHVAESDEEREDTYVDAMTLGLHHSTTDVFIAIPGSELSLSVKRDTQSEVWNMRSGLRPHERPDKPFGVSWNSNLTPHVEWVSEPSEPTYAYVTDQSGATHRFIQWIDENGDLQFTPMPTAKHENSDYLSTFDGEVFTSKFGTTLTFEGTNIFSSISTDRKNGSQKYQSRSFSRVTTITDRVGNKLIYTYSDNGNYTALIPDRISLSSNPSVSIYIAQDGNGLITSVWDANGNRVRYDYDSFTYQNDGVTYTEKKLVTVTAADSTTTSYKYNFSSEGDLTPLKDGDTKVDKLHCDVSELQDPNGHTYKIEYLFDHTKWNYTTIGNAGYYQQTGNPRNVSKITLPNTGATNFANQSDVRIAYDTDGKARFVGVRHTSSKDAMGKTVTYSFEKPTVAFLNSINLTDPYNPITIPKIIYFRSMIVGFQGVGSETYTFDPNAGLALSSIKDLSGNTTTFAHTESLSLSKANELFPSSFNGSFEDPTSQTDALQQTKSFHYGTFRIMDNIVDEAGRTTHYDLDEVGRRRAETITYHGQAVQKTLFEYSNEEFPGVVTKSTLKINSGPSWATDLVKSYNLDNAGRVHEEIVDPDRLHLKSVYTYDLNGNKLSSTDPLSNTTSFDYDCRNRLVLITFADLSFKSFSYDARGNKKRETDENGNSTLFAYDALNRITDQARDMNGNGIIDSRAIDIVSSYTYNDVNSKLTQKDPRGAITSFDYDDLQRLKSTTTPELEEAPNGYTTSYLYEINSGGNAFDSSSFKPTLITDPRFHTEISYDNLYRPIERKAEYKPGIYSKTVTGYDEVGNPTTETDDLQHSTSTTFDALNRPLVTTFADNTRVSNSYTSTGLKWLFEDENHKKTETQYDSAGRPVIVLQPTVNDEMGAPHQPKTETVYDAYGNVKTTINPLLRRWDYLYDVRNRKTVETQPDVVDGNTGIVKRPVITFGYDLAANIIYRQDAKGYTTETLYDEANRAVRVTMPPVPIYGQIATRPIAKKEYDANSNVTITTDANSRSTINTFDALNRLKTTLDPENILVQNEYDSAGNLVKVTDGKNQVTKFAYDGLNRNTEIRDLAQNATSFEYNGVNKTTRTDALRHVTVYGYDQRNRLKSVQYTGRSLDNRAFDYDDHGNLIGVTEPGKDGADVAYHYDALNRMDSEVSAGVRHNYVYDLVGNKKSVTYGATGRVITSIYDKLNRLSSLMEGDRNTLYDYDLNGNRAKVTLPNLETITTTYDGMNRVQAVVARKPNTKLNYQYLNGYDKVGNVQWVDEYYGEIFVWRDITMDYDGSNRLRHERVTDKTGYTKSTGYNYDNANNRSQMIITNDNGDVQATTDYVFNSLNQLTSFSTLGGSGVYSYDVNGSRIYSQVITPGLGTAYSTNTQSCDYDYENRLIQLSESQTSTVNGLAHGLNKLYTYVYDYRTRRVSRKEADQLTKVVFSGGTSVQEFNQTITPGNLAAEYVRSSDTNAGIGGLVYSLRSSNPSYNHYDRRGDITEKTNASGDSIYQASYLSFGQHPNDLGVTLDRQKANTKEEDPTGLLNEGMRYRDLLTGAFITRDPTGFVDGPNLYTYVRQNPWTSFDPEGLWIGADDAIAAGGGALIGMGVQGAMDLWHGRLSSFKDYAASAVGGAAAGEAALYTGGLGSGAAYGAASNLTKQGLNNLDGTQHGFDAKGLVVDTAVGAVAGKVGEVIAPVLVAGAKQVVNSMTKSASTEVTESLIEGAASTKGPITWVDEAHGNLDASAYESGAQGHVPGSAPRLSATDAEGTVTAKFDGVDGSVMIDRKLSVTTFPKAENQMLRQSATAAENGYSVRWEVPNAAQAARAQKMAESLGVTNVDVGVK